ncbi:hypothetical protein [Alicyclobacillus dauci]|uniref:Uncharacterized protein n=1 Tax=Alicyclobacillus dauci TaxID=1475485 RepID=A0ABY6YYA9_9BACL|nr:hypothetical protein [Alicyclobacillus dauci]WAH35278.1 hypothetical protein NZD86_13260 [Alicyclobacillus dauci]
MRSIKGYEAIEIAEQYNLPLYDQYYKNDITVREAKQFIQSRRDPQSFVLENWPDTDEEAEQMVLNLFNKALAEHDLSTGQISELSQAMGSLPINQYAAELAAQRLVAAGKLEVIDSEAEWKSYRVPRKFYLRESFLDQLSDMVCHECARLELDGPFHEACLTKIIDYLSSSSVSFDDIAEMRNQQSVNNRLAKIIRPGMGLLSKGVSETKSRWQSILKPILNPDNEVEADRKSGISSEKNMDVDMSSTLTMVAHERLEPIEPANHQAESASSVMEDTLEERDTMERTKTRITKEDLIEYLRGVEILDDTGELMRLQRERTELRRQIAEHEREIAKFEQQRTYWEKQIEAMNRDMDTMIAAMQIAKRRAAKSDATVIDADIHTDNEDEVHPR